jgi:hypothetical protein
VCRAQDNHPRDLGRRRLAQEVELSALLDQAREELGVGEARDCAIEALVTVEALLDAKQVDRLPRLCQQVEAPVLGNAHPGLMTLLLLVVLAYLDIIHSSPFEFQPAADQEVIVPRDVTGLQQAQLQAATTREHTCGARGSLSQTSGGGRASRPRSGSIDLAASGFARKCTAGVQAVTMSGGGGRPHGG